MIEILAAVTRYTDDARLLTKERDKSIVKARAGSQLFLALVMNGVNKLIASEGTSMSEKINFLSGDAYIPTLLEYAKVIDWLWDERHNQIHPAGVHMSDFPDGLAKPFEDALHRAALSRVADRMEKSLHSDALDASMSRERRSDANDF